MATAGPVVIASSALAFSLLVVFGRDWVSLPVPLYFTEACEAAPTCAPMVPRIPLLPLVGAVLIVAWLQGWAAAAVLRGLVVGLAGSAYAGLVDVSAIPFRDPYFVTVYRVYGILYLTLVTTATVTLLLAIARQEGAHRSGERLLAALMLGVVFVSAAAAALRLELISSAGVLVGTLIALWIVRSRAYQRIAVTQLEAWAVPVIFLGAIAARAAFGLLTLSRTGPGLAFAYASDDGDAYFILASALAADPAELGYVLAASAFPPGYSLLLAAIFAITAQSLTAVVLVQSVLGGVGAVLVHRLARPLMGGRLALVPAFIYAADMNLIQNQSTLTAEAFLLPQILLTLWTLDRYRITDDGRWLLAAATAIGLVFITRNVVAAPLVMATVLAWVFWRRSLRAVVRDMAVIVIALLVFSLPVALASAEREGRPRFVTQLATVVWSFDMGPHSAMISNSRLVEMGIVPFEDPLGSAVRAFGQLDRVVAFYAEAVPVRLSGLLFAASPGLSDPLLIVNPAEYPNSFDGVTRVLRAVGLAVAGVFLFIGRPWRAHPQLLLYAFFATLYIAVFTFVFSPNHPYRYRLPVEPLRLMAEVAGIWILVRFLAPYWTSSAKRRRAQIPGIGTIAPG